MMNEWMNTEYVSSMPLFKQNKTEEKGKKRTMIGADCLWGDYILVVVKVHIISIQK